MVESMLLISLNNLYLQWMRMDKEATWERP